MTGNPPITWDCTYYNDTGATLTLRRLGADERHVHLHRPVLPGEPVGPGRRSYCSEGPSPCEAGAGSSRVRSFPFQLPRPLIMAKNSSKKAFPLATYALFALALAAVGAASCGGKGERRRLRSGHGRTSSGASSGSGGGGERAAARVAFASATATRRSGATASGLGSSSGQSLTWTTGVTVDDCANSSLSKSMVASLECGRLGRLGDEVAVPVRRDGVPGGPASASAAVDGAVGRDAERGVPCT